MEEIRKHAIVLLLGIIQIFIFGHSANCQENDEELPVFKAICPLVRQNSYQISYRPAYYLPLQGTNTYISNGRINPIGLSFEIVMPNKYSFGIETGQQYYQEYKPRDIYDYDGSIYSTSQVRTLKLNPFLFTTNKHFTKIESNFRPYAQLGLGICSINYVNYWGYLIDEKKRWNPMAMPAIGLKINLDNTYTWVIDTKIKYQIAPFQYDFISKVNYFSADISLAFRWWKE
jgi:hypothetical protein